MKKINLLKMLDRKTFRLGQAKSIRKMVRDRQNLFHGKMDSATGSHKATKRLGRSTPRSGYSKGDTTAEAHLQGFENKRDMHIRLLGATAAIIGLGGGSGAMLAEDATEDEKIKEIRKLKTMNKLHSVSSLHNLTQLSKLSSAYEEGVKTAYDWLSKGIRAKAYPKTLPSARPTLKPVSNMFSSSASKSGFAAATKRFKPASTGSVAPAATSGATGVPRRGY